jgi:hypothetical protein
VTRQALVELWIAERLERAAWPPAYRLGLPHDRC